MMTKIFYAVFTEKQANDIFESFRTSDRVFGGFISGKIIDSLIIGLLCFITLTIMQMPYTLVVSVVVGVTNIIPFFGPYIGAIPSALLILIENPIKGIYFIVFIIILQQFDGNILGPKIIGQSTGLTAFWVVFAILLGGGLFGIFGLIVGVPAFAVIYGFVKKYVDERLEKKGIQIE
jgi:predicted PurR-regulated permease PerM